jgi:hypothetical protein
MSSLSVATGIALHGRSRRGHQVPRAMTKTIIEPFRIKSIEPICQTTREQRERRFETAGYKAPFLRHFTARFPRIPA